MTMNRWRHTVAQLRSVLATLSKQQETAFAKQTVLVE